MIWPDPLQWEGDFDESFDELDTNSDGTISAEDCPYQYGSPKAKLWWKKIQEPFVKTQTTTDMKVKYGDRVVGAYKGKPLVPGEAGRGQGDFLFLTDKLRVTRGFSLSQAQNVAGRINTNLYGG
jgi:hypothetical protein